MLDQNGFWYETKKFIVSLKDIHGSDVVNKRYLYVKEKPKYVTMPYIVAKIFT